VLATERKSSANALKENIKPINITGI